MTQGRARDKFNDWPLPWPSPAYPHPAPVDESWRGLAKQIHDAVTTGDLPAEWGICDLLRMLGLRDPDPTPGRHNTNSQCLAVTKLGHQCRNPAIPTHDYCRFHLYVLGTAAIHRGITAL